MVLPTSIPLPTRTPAPVRALPGYGPWGLIGNQDGLWAMRSDGAQVELLTNDPILRLSIASSRRLVAYVTHSDPFNNPDEKPFGYTLKIMNLSTGRVTTVAKLDLPGISASSSPEELDHARQALLALQNGGLQWSPGGNYLAFVSAHSGPSGDVYVYRPSTGAMRRLTNLELPEGPAFAYNLSFARTGYSIYYAAAHHFDNVAGNQMAGAWVTTVSGLHKQVAGNEFAGEEIVSWINDSNLLLSSWNSDCGDQNSEDD